MDQILYWNDVALEANKVSHTTGIDKGVLGPTLSSRALAIIVHLAMYDAYVGTTSGTGLSSYLGIPAGPAGTTNAAISGAAFTALSKLFPSQVAYFGQKLSESGSTGLEDGFVYGVSVANAIMADRAADPDASSYGYTAPTGRGAHKPDPDNPDQGIYAPFYGARCKCFSVGTRFTLDPPPAFGTPKYEAAETQVREKELPLN